MSEAENEARRLIRLFYNVYPIANLYLAKESALIAVDEKIQSLQKFRSKLGGYDMLSGLLKQEIEIDIYELGKVKSEIEKM